MGSENSFPMDDQMCPMLSRPCTILFTSGRGCFKHTQMTRCCKKGRVFSKFTSVGLVSTFGTYQLVFV
jgi:hypothetical protein